MIFDNMVIVKNALEMRIFIKEMGKEGHVYSANTLTMCSDHFRVEAFIVCPS